MTTPRMSGFVNFYTELGLKNFENDLAVIRKAYLVKAKETHSDKTQSADHTAFITVKEAYSVLSDAKKRDLYDAELQLRLAVIPATLGNSALSDLLNTETIPCVRTYGYQMRNYKPQYYNSSHGFRYNLPELSAVLTYDHWQTRGNINNGYMTASIERNVKNNPVEKGVFSIKQSCGHNYHWA